MPDYTCNRNNNTIYYSGRICQEGIMYLKQCLDNLDTEKKSTFYITSGGGEVYAGLFLYDLIAQQNPALFSIVVCGFCASAATMCLFATENVSMYKNARLLFHPISFSLYDVKQPDAISYVAECEELTKVCLEIENQKLKTPIGWENKEVYINAKQALDLGIVKEII